MRGSDRPQLAGSVVHMDEVVSTIAAAAGSSDGAISYDDVRLPFPEEVDATSLTAAVGALDDTPFAEGVADTVSRFRTLLAAGLVSRDDPTRTSCAERRPSCSQQLLRIDTSNPPGGETAAAEMLHGIPHPERRGMQPGGSRPAPART